MMAKFMRAVGRIQRDVPGADHIVQQMRSIMLAGEIDDVIAYLDNLNATDRVFRKPVIDIVFDEVYS